MDYITITNRNVMFPRLIEQGSKSELKKKIKGKKYDNKNFVGAGQVKACSTVSWTCMMLLFHSSKLKFLR